MKPASTRLTLQPSASTKRRRTRGSVDTPDMRAIIDFSNNEIPVDRVRTAVSRPHPGIPADAAGRRARGGARRRGRPRGLPPRPAGPRPRLVRSPENADAGRHQGHAGHGADAADPADDVGLQGAQQARGCPARRRDEHSRKALHGRGLPGGSRHGARPSPGARHVALPGRQRPRRASSLGVRHLLGRPDRSRRGRFERHRAVPDGHDRHARRRAPRPPRTRRFRLRRRSVSRHPRRTPSSRSVSRTRSRASCPLHESP